MHKHIEGKVVGGEVGGEGEGKKGPRPQAEPGWI